MSSPICNRSVMTDMAKGAAHLSLAHVSCGDTVAARLLCGHIRHGACMDDQSKHDDLSRLLVASAAGDRAAFAMLYQNTSRRLFAVGLRVVERRDWAEEVVQEAYVRIWRKASSFDAGRGGAMAWMATITRNLAIDRLRRERWEISTRADGYDDSTPEPSADMIDEILLRDDSRALTRCLDTLSDNSRRAILLAYCWGYTYDELSEVFEVPVNTVKSWTRRGLLRLKVCMSQ